MDPELYRGFNEKLLDDNNIVCIGLNTETLQDEGDRNISRRRLIYLGLLDSLLSTLIVAPLVISCWRGIWGLMDIYDDYFPTVQSYVFGIVIHISFALLRQYLLETSRKQKVKFGPRTTLSMTQERLASRLYTAVFTIACILHWRGGWLLLDMVVKAGMQQPYNVPKTFSLLVITVFLIFTALVLKCAKNLLASPYFLVTDGKEPTYVFPTRFRKESSRDTALYVLDCVFSVLVVGSLVVFVWRGTWVLLDTYLYPDDEVKSAFGSLVLGYALVALTFALQAPMRWACARLHGAIRVATADVFLLISFLATVNVWRGIWNLLDLYFIPENPELSNWISHGVSFLLLMLLNCSNSVLVRGVYIDAEEPAGECVVFPCHYLRIFFHKERAKKRHRKILLAAAARRKADIEVGPHHHHAPALLPMLEPQLPSDPADADCPTNTLIPTSDTLLRTVIEKV